ADPRAHSVEHSLEVQVPFLLRRNPNVQIVPVLIGRAVQKELREISAAIARTIQESRERVLLLASSDLNHYEDRETSNHKDKLALDAVVNLDEETLLEQVATHNISMCGVLPAYIVLVAAKALGAKHAELLNYRTSGDVNGDYSAVVGYGAVARCTLPILVKHMSIDPRKVTIIDFDQNEDALKPWIAQGMTFIKDRVTEENLGSLLGKHLSAGDMLIDLAWNIECTDILQWCHDRGVLYVNTSVELWDPGSGTFNPTGALGTARDHHTATLLRDGRVLIAGGDDYNNHYFDTAELYDPDAGTFSATGSMATARQGHTATRLDDGRVLIAGGDNGGRSNLASAELYDPSTGKFSATGSMTKARAHHTATLLTDGRVLIVGGCRVTSECNSTLVASAEIYDPNGGTFSATGLNVNARAWHAASVLPDGRVFVAGGVGATVKDLSSAEAYDPQSGTFSETGSMAKGRWDYTATQLTDGRVLLVGGWGDKSVALASVEVYDPQMSAFSPTGSMTTVRDAHTATLLKDGRVLVVGGRDGDNWPTATAELYQP
ncbi:MAG: AmmeMemoRadiSam system protein B, partial [Candidatus Limnocylindrales bacterium]